jgi:uncharacterized protein (TIGR03437 family)
MIPMMNRGSYVLPGCIRYVLTGLLASAILSAQSAVFVARAPITVGLSPAAIATSDFFGNRESDLAVINAGSATVSVVPGQGNGIFLPSTNLKVGVNPRAIAVGDFNRDGTADLVVGNFTSDTVSVLLGNGNGTFRSAQSLTASGPTAIAVADFNSDGYLDLAVVNANGNNISIFLGAGNGIFRPPVNYDVGTDPSSIAVGAVNGDAMPDIVVSNAGSNNVSILLGNGDGTFRPFPSVAAGRNPVSISLADFNGDGIPDLAVANANGESSGISVLLGYGNGLFRDALSFPLGTNPSFFVSADFNGDGKLDVAVANVNLNTITVLLGFGDGTFYSPSTITVGDGPAWISVADLNGDGKPDMLVANGVSNTVSVLINDTSTASQPSITGIANGASFQTGPVAPGEIVTIFGSNVGPNQLTTLQSSSGLVGTTLAGTRVLFDGIASPLIYVSASQDAAVVPYEILGKQNTQVQVEFNGTSSNAVSLQVNSTAPALFTANSSGIGQGAILNQDGSVNSSSNSAEPGSVIVLFGTGEGQTDPSGIDGSVPGNVAPKPLAHVSVSIGGVDANVLYAGGTPGLVAGVLQINAQIPEGVGSGDVPVVVTIGQASSPAGVTVSVK